MDKSIKGFKREYLSGPSVKELYDYVEVAIQELGLEYFIFRMILPALQDKASNGTMLTNIPSAIMKSYEENKGWDNQIVKHCCGSILPITWCIQTFSDSPHLWELMQKTGGRYGWSQALHDHSGIVSLITVLRADKAVSDQELVDKGGDVMWLCAQLHTAFMFKCAHEASGTSAFRKVTAREIEVLQWYGLGKTAAEIAEILNLSSRTVNFHLNNTYRKLGASNHKQALVIAAKAGLI